MRVTQTLAALLTVVATVTAQMPTCGGCQSCGLACQQSCAAPLVATDCEDCLYCRRESSYCSNIELDLQKPPSPHCQTCYSSCQCKMAAICYDDLPPVTASSSSSGTAPPAAAMTKPLVAGGNDLFGRRFDARARA
ncbi:hypothetical protein PG996_013356 [Apiospora saccharicola]|uniref:Uncharacterized protein n=1 Tax=Apiospora saccharicola TaxID=335842 RepID=A0ABR1U587_9PEZI